MPRQAIRRFSMLLGFAAIFCAASAHAQQYVYRNDNYSSGSQTYYPSASTNYVSVPGSNPYQVPAATATSYQHVSVPGSAQYQNPYPPISVPDGTPAPQVAPAVSNVSNQQNQGVAADPNIYDSAPSNSQYQNSQYQNSYQAPPPAPSYAPSPQYQTAQAGSGIQGLPSYRYDPNLDPKKDPPYKAPSAEQREAGSEPVYHPYMGLETRSGLDLGVQFFYYSYAEPSLSVTEEGEPIGLTARGTYAFGDGFFATGDVRYMFGDIDYNGSGSLDDAGVDSWELRGLFGKDFMLTREYSISPYTGIGYRTLFNDNRGTTSDGASGYRRFNILYYLPIGIYPRTHLDSESRLTSTLEYDYVMHGLQTSYLSDGNTGDPNIHNVQSGGYGIRGDISYETRSWSLGPFFTYWSIDQSKTKLALDSSPVTCAGLGTPCIISGDEPANHTFEAGVQFKYHFF